MKMVKSFGIPNILYVVRDMIDLRWGKIEFIITPNFDFQDFVIAEKK